MTMQTLLKGRFPLHAKGYPWIKNRGELRDKMVHRVVVEFLAMEQIEQRPTAPLYIPDGWVCHHIDFDKSHRCPSNLLILPPAIHDFMSLDHINFLNSHKADW